MKLPDGVRRWFRLPRNPQDVDREITDELEFHIATRTDDLVRLGYARGAARARALEEFGDVKAARAELGAIDTLHVQSMQRAEWWSGVAQDVKFAWRSVVRQPGLTLIIALTLGLGLGANATSFELVDRLLYRPPEHVVAADQLRRIYFHSEQWQGRTTFPSTTVPDYLAFRREARTIDVAAFMGTEGTMGRGESAQKIDLGVASANFFTLLGVKPYIGRFYTEAEDSPPHGSRVVVLAYEFWQGRLRGDRQILGKPLLIGSHEFTVVGIAPKGFSGIDLNAMDVWVPLSTIANEWVGDSWTTSRRMSWLRPVGRLRAGASPEMTQQELTRIWHDADSVSTPSDQIADVIVGPIQEARGAGAADDVQRNGKVATWLAGVSLLVLLVACANVANLLLTRTIRRRRETGIRLALGVGRPRLLRQFLIEGFMLSGLAAVSAIAFAHWGGAILRATILPSADFRTALFDPRLLLYIAVATLFTVAAMTAVPAIQMVRESIIPALKSGPRDGYGRSRMRTSLLFVQAVLSVVLLIGAGLFVRSFYNVRTMDLGFDAERVLIADVDLSVIGYKRDQRVDFYLRARDAISKLGGVEAVAVAGSVPFYSALAPELRAEGVDSIPVPSTGGPYSIGVTPEYFAASGVAIVRGRGFSDADNKGAPLVAVVNESFASTVWPGQNAIGKCLHLDIDEDPKAPCTMVVGIAESARKMSVDREPVLDYYVPLAQRKAGIHALFIRSKADPAELQTAVRRQLQALQANLPFVNVYVLQDLVDPQLRSWKLGATLFSAFGVLALLLSAIGLYSMLSYAVASRTAEVGVRMALGARAADVMKMVIRDGVIVAAAGVVVGVIGTLLLAQRVGPLLFDVTPSDPISYAGASVLLLLVALIAALIPARRATNVDPAVALKSE